MDMRKIEKAASQQKLVRISYTDAKGITTIRTLEPYEIKDNTFFGFDTSKNGIRAFKITQISSIDILEIEFIPRFPIKLAMMQRD